MSDDTFHTDRDVGEFIEGRRRSSRVANRGDRSRTMARQKDQMQEDQGQNKMMRGNQSKNAALLDMIEDMEAQLEALSRRSQTPAPTTRRPRAPAANAYDTSYDAYDDELTAVPEPQPVRPRRPAHSTRRRRGSETGEYRTALERIEAQLHRVDEALDSKRHELRQQPPLRTNRSKAHGSVAEAMASTRQPQPAPRAPARGPVRSHGNDGLSEAIRTIRDRAASMPNRPPLSSARFETPAMPSRSPASRRDAFHGEDADLTALREDIASLRHLLEEANLSGASERVLNEIAALSGRIDTLTNRMTATQQDPELLDAIRDIHALLDRPAQDPSLDAHFDRILSKLDGLPIRDHFEDFARLSAQMDTLRTLLDAAPRAQQISDISGQMSMMVERLGSLEADVRRNADEASRQSETGELESRLFHLQQMIEELNPNDRLESLEGQLSTIADQLEQASSERDMRKPLELLARQVESLVMLIGERDNDDQQEALELLASRIADLDLRMRDMPSGGVAEQRFDHVEQTLARIDDMLANRMDSADLSSIETGLSRLADRIEAQEATLRALPVAGSSSEGGMDFAGLEKLEQQIADLADRLDDAGRGGDDQQFLDTLTSRLDALADQFARSQSRFDAVDRMGEDIRKLAHNQNAPSGPLDHNKIAEAAALKALQKAGPMSAGPVDGTLDAIIDGLKDDLHGLRRMAETTESSTQQGLSSVSGMLNTIVERLGALEEEMRAEDRKPAAPVALHPGAPTVTTEDTPLDADEPRGFGRLLRRSRKKDKAAAAAASEGVAQTQSMSAEELLASRTGRQSRSAPSARPAPTGRPAAAQAGSDAVGAPREPSIKLSGKAVNMASREASATAARQQGDAARGQSANVQLPRPQSLGNAALKADPAPASAPERRTAQIVGGREEGPKRAPSTGESPSKADFIAAARRAAQAAAQESERVEKAEKEGRGLFSRLRGGNKQTEALAGDRKDLKSAQDTLEGMNRKERRATIAEAARKAKKIKEESSNALKVEIDERDAAALVNAVAEKGGEGSLFAKLGGILSRYSRPLLIAAAAIVLAITTLQLAQNPNSSLHSLFNANPAIEQQGDAVSDSLPQGVPQGSAPMTAPSGMPPSEITGSAPEGQSTLTPSSGNLMPTMHGEDASRAIAFSSPSGAQNPLTGPGPMTVPEATAPKIGPTIANAQQDQLAPQISGVDPLVTSALQQTNGQALAQPPVLEAPAVEDAATSGNTKDARPAAPSASPLMKAATDGDPLAQFEMGRRLTLGEGMATDLAAAAKWFEQAAEQSMPQAQYSIANLYEKGKGVQKDLQVARLWYERAADAGNVKAMHNLAVLYAEGGLGEPDFKHAAEWFAKAADHGLKDSQYNLAILQARGMGIKQDLLQSYKWFAIAAKSGDQGAMSKRDEVFAVLTPAQQKTAEALVAAWVPKLAKPSANSVANIPDAWKADAQTTVASSASPAPSLALDANVISKAQSMLGALGYNAGPADGQMGPMTRTAIRNFQESAGLPVTGVIDEGLLEALSLRVI